jgi:dTDP-4-amino-4,6-dideoxygalactose transaminase
MIPLVDLKRDVAVHREAYLALTARVLDSGVFSLGPEVEAFERSAADYFGTGFAVGVSSGTMALYGALLALDIAPGSEVLVPASTFVASAEAIVMAGFRPVFCDVDEATGLLDLADASVRVTPNTAVVMPVHLYGRAQGMDAVMAFASAHGLKVVEDASQAHGATWRGRRVGSWGDAGCFSCYPTKNLGALGEGGFVTMSDPVFAENVKAVRLHGIKKVKYQHDRFGSNLKMEALQGAFLAHKLSRLEAANTRRRVIAARYVEALQGLDLGLPEVGPEMGHVFHLFVVQSDRRDALKAHLEARGIGCGIHYPVPVHRQPAFSAFAADCPRAEKMASRILSLPMFPELADAEVDEVVAAVRSFYA